MTALARIALSLWAGAMACAAFVVAPRAFDTVGAPGDFLRPIFRTIDLFGLGAACLGLLVVEPRASWRGLLLVTMAAALAAHVLFIAPRAAEPAWHAVSVSTWLFLLAGGVVILAAGLHRPHG